MTGFCARALGALAIVTGTAGVAGAQVACGALPSAPKIEISETARKSAPGPVVVAPPGGDTADVTVAPERRVEVWAMPDAVDCAALPGPTGTAFGPSSSPQPGVARRGAGRTVQKQALPDAD